MNKYLRQLFTAVIALFVVLVLSSTISLALIVAPFWPPTAR